MITLPSFVTTQMVSKKEKRRLVRSLKNNKNRKSKFLIILQKHKE